MEGDITKKKLTQLIVVLGLLIVPANILANDLRVAEFTKIRMDYAKRADFDPGWERHADRGQITDLWDNNKIDEGVELAKQWLKKHPVDAQMHLWYAFFLWEKGDFQGSFRHKFFYQGLLASITSSGSGLSSDSPMKVISVSEEYSVLKALNAKLIRQSLTTCKSGIPCDAMECEMGEEQVTWYFDISISMDHINKMLNPEAEKKKAPK